MIFQTLDDKAQCVGIYADNKLHFDPKVFPDNLQLTWKYASYLRNLPIEYASLYLEGQPLEERLPEYLKEDWADVTGKIESFRRSLKIAQVDMNENCFFDLVPERFLIDFCKIKNNITEHITKTVKKPKRYEFNKHVSMMLGDIENRRIKINKRLLKSYFNDKKMQNQARQMVESPYVCYKQFGTKTGRLSTKPNTFPILTLNKALRSVVEPTNDFFIELDFNGAEVRTLLGLLGKEQPDGDVHNYHLEHVFKTLTTREEAKVAFFAWLYGSSRSTNPEESKRLANFYQKQDLLKEYWSGASVRTCYSKTIQDVDEHHALNYIVQSTAAELTLKQALKIDYLLRTRSSGSEISFLIHDAIIIDMKKDDFYLLESLISLMQSTNFGNFKINIKKGSNLGSLKDLIRG
jgi:hypothetical protein